MRRTYQIRVRLPLFTHATLLRPHGTTVEESRDFYTLKVTSQVVIAATSAGPHNKCNWYEHAPRT